MALLESVAVQSPVKGAESACGQTILKNERQRRKYSHGEGERGLSKRAGDLFATLHVADVSYALFQRSQVLFDGMR